ncbi:hypothetical protein [Flavobacterium ginsenosidimutans]|uniref:Secretion system C-terminal sorting domain-containing protein n=1 Tax=Flavobacterium ginsenosidimutans TaxID=687844 RepID=A0ABZ2Q790_9FLAO|nr:hypothetical protein [Flavobacterium ginsenosidimutans]KAF2332844.1 hypothetical protein DM444_08510 [Flavobacterium ginsenosidimutans]
MKAKLLLLTFLFFGIFGIAQNSVSYSSLNTTLNLNSGVEGTSDIVVSCFGSSGIPVVLNTFFLCGNPDGYISYEATNGHSLTPGQTTTLKFKFKKTVTTDTQIVYKFSTNGSCFQEESKMIKITVNYKGSSTTNPTNPTNPTNSNVITNTNPQYIYEDNTIQPLIGSDMGSNVTYQWYRYNYDGQGFKIIAGATNKDYRPEINNGLSFKDNFVANYTQYRRHASNGSISNVVDIQVNSVLSVSIQNNTISLLGSEIQGSTPTGGNGTYEYSWKYTSEEIGTFEFTGEEGKNLKLPSWIYNPNLPINVYEGVVVTRFVKSRNRVVSSNELIIQPLPETVNNIITINGSTITGSLPAGGDGVYEYSWQYTSAEIGTFEFPGEVGQHLVLPSWVYNANLPINVYQGMTVTRTVKSRNRPSLSNVLTLPSTKANKITSKGINAEDLTVYPNPTSESINFATNFSADKELEIVLYSEKLGNEKSVYKGKVTPNQVVNWKIPANYQKGLYFYKILSDNKELKSGKVIFN